MHQNNALSSSLRNPRNKNLICNVLSTTTKCRKNLPQILAVCVKNVMLIGFGMTLGFPTVLIGGLEDSKVDFQMTHEQLSWIGAINLIFVPLGCLVSGPYCDKFGRKKAMQMANIPLALVWLLFRYSSSPWHLYLALSVIGILLGLIEAPVVTYVSEVTTPNLRGILFSTSTLFTILGTLCSFFLGSIYYWRSVAQIAFLVPLISINLLFLIPESPHWLIKMNRFDDAQKSLAWLRGWVTKEDIHQEYATLNAFIHNNPTSESKPTSCFNYTSPSFLKPYFLISVVFFLRHFSGITNIQTYAVEIFQHLHAPMDKYNATTFMGVFELLGCITCVCLIRRLGKRKLTFFTMGCSIIALSTIPIYSYGSLGKDRNWIPMSGLFAYCFFQHCSLRTLPWILIGEVYTPQTRSIASGISAATGYFFGFFANKLFYGLVNELTLNGVFIMYMLVLFFGGCVLYVIMPETEGKSLEEICEYFANSRNDKNSVDGERIERNNNNNKEIKEYKGSHKDLYATNKETVDSDKDNDDNITYNKVKARRTDSSDDYIQSLNRLAANDSGPSYKRFESLNLNDI
ncbi:facilitated trehalose transporter Tret1-like [Atheta coriaria]|uniref:facilitated trehalose transporter Tret1-like n=1 Tax=Dalotia coriaria TaxID=877792 RepID=UPI0031F3C519